MVTEANSRFKEVAFPENELIPSGLWAELSFPDDSTAGDGGIAGSEDMAESMIPEDKLIHLGLWAELPFADELNAVATGIVTNKPLAVSAQLEACGVALRAADCELGESSNVDEQMASYQNATGDKEVKKWKEKDWVWNKVVERKGVVVEAGGGLDKQRAT